jgi:hypothetical protein
MPHASRTLPGALFHRIISHLQPWHENRTAALSGCELPDPLSSLCQLITPFLGHDAVGGSYADLGMSPERNSPHAFFMPTGAA